MTYLCLHVDSEGVLSGIEVLTVSACNGYIADLSTNFGLSSLTYTDANQLLGATAGIFVLAYVLRAVLDFIRNRRV